MTARDVSSRLLLAIALAIVVAIGGCYDAPKPDCGFRCGPSGACPSDYTCGDDNRCRLNGSSPSISCAPPDAPVPPDAYSPGVVFVTPPNNSNVNPDTNILVGFDIDVAGVTDASFLVSTAAGDPVPGTVVYDAGTRIATFTGTEGLPPNSQITVRLTSDIFDPLSTRALRPTTFMFATGEDTTPPTVLSTTPPDGATGISVATNVDFAFSEPVTGINSTTVELRDSATMQPVPGTVTYNMAARTATFDPLDQLAPNLGYIARLLVGITDVEGNALSTPQTLTFTTGPDFVGPNVRATMPPANATGVTGSTIVIVFDEPVANVTTTTFQVNAGAVTGTITMSSGNRVATFDPTASLPAASTITVTLSAAITDTSSNPASAATFSFTTN